MPTKSTQTEQGYGAPAGQTGQSSNRERHECDAFNKHGDSETEDFPKEVTREAKAQGASGDNERNGNFKDVANDIESPKLAHTDAGTAADSRLRSANGPSDVSLHVEDMLPNPGAAAMPLGTRHVKDQASVGMASPSEQTKSEEEKLLKTASGSYLRPIPDTKPLKGRNTSLGHPYIGYLLDWPTLDSDMDSDAESTDSDYIWTAESIKRRNTS